MNHGILQTELPQHHGEKEFARKLLRNLPEGSKAWFNLLIPGCNEVDTLIMHPKFGFYLIEVKSKPLTMVKHYDARSCELEGQSSFTHPLRQALQAVYPLKQRFEDYGYRAPWIRSTAAFPLISRSEFNRKFNKTDDPRSIIGDQIGGMIFAEDLMSAEHLEARLEQATVVPPIGATPKNLKFDAARDFEVVSKVFGIFNSEATKASQFKIEPHKPRKDSIKQFTEPDHRSPVVINGLPGSGKTQALLDIAVSHAARGRNSLFVCFNKVLATRFRQDMDALETVDSDVKSRVLIADIFDLKKALEDDYMKETYQNFFETVCVDESQDLYHLGQDRDLLEFIDPVVATGAEWFFAYGRDQELYGGLPERVKTALENSENVQELRRTRASSTDSFRESVFSQVGFDYGYNPEKAETAAKDILRRVQDDPSQSDQLFKHAMNSVSESEIPAQATVEDYEKILEMELRKAKELGAFRDVMILFPRKNPITTGRDKVRQALENLRIPYHDQVENENRRKRLEPGQVRLVTVHSARGLQATRTILFAPHLIAALTPSDDAKVWNSVVPYIALSRAMNGTRIVTSAGEDPSDFQRYVHECHKAYTTQMVNQLMNS